MHITITNFLAMNFNIVGYEVLSAAAMKRHIFLRHNAVQSALLVAPYMLGFLLTFL
jgi:hypothetical protein